MSILSQSDFAKLCGTSRQNIYALAKNGTLELTDSGEIDTENKKNRDYKSKNGERAMNKNAQLSPKDQSDLNTLEELKKKKLVADILKRQIENDEKRGVLIPRDTVASYIAKVHAIDQTQFYNLGQNLAPEITALCGINDEGKEIEIQALIEDAVYRIADNAKRLMDNFLRELKIEEDSRE